MYNREYANFQYITLRSSNADFKFYKNIIDVVNKLTQGHVKKRATSLYATFL